MATKKVKYVEPVEYFSKETRKMFGLGEFAKEANSEANDKKAPAKKTDTKKTDTKKK